MELQDIKKVVILGAGLMGSSIAQTFPEYNYITSIYCNDENEFVRAKEIIKNCQETLVENKLLTREKSEEIMNAIQYTSDPECVKDADFIIESITESVEIKQEVFRLISKYAPKDAIIVSNTSAISINLLSESVSFPERFCGSHWLNPPHIIPLVEITKSEKTSEKVVETLYQLYKKMDKKPIILEKDVKGFLSNRLQFALLREATHLVEMGIATPQDIDATIRFGNGLRYMCSGPFKIADLGGISVFNAVSKYLYPDLADDKVQNNLLEEMEQNGHNGISTGEGFYKYSKEDQENEEKNRDNLILKVLKMEDLDEI